MRAAPLAFNPSSRCAKNKKGEGHRSPQMSPKAEFRNHMRRCTFSVLFAIFKSARLLAKHTKRLKIALANFVCAEDGAPTSWLLF